MIPGLVYDLCVLSLSPWLGTYILSKYRRKLNATAIFGWFSSHHIISDVVVHSSSVGETKGALLFSQKLKELLPHREIINTVFTDTALRTFPGTRKIPPPLFAIHSSRVRTKSLIFFESDLWPSYILSVKGRRGKVFVVSGRMSERTSRLWSGVPLLRKTAMVVDRVFAKDERNAENFLRAGFRYVSVSEDMKGLIFLRGRNRERIKLGKKVLFGLSTRGRRELDFLLDFYRRFCGEFGLIVAPRHDFKEAEEVISERAKCFKISEVWNEKQLQGVVELLREKIEDGSVILLDLYGRVDEFLKMSDLCFVGGTLVPIGGHNVLEPLSFGIPVVVGPNNWNIEPELMAGGLVTVVRDINELAQVVKKIMDIEIRIEDFINRKRAKMKKELEKIASYLEFS